MLDDTIYEEETIALGLGIKGEVLLFEALAVKTDEVTRLTEDGGELVHDPTLHPDVVVFGGLTNLS